MTDDLKPTPEDMARDLAADLWPADATARYFAALAERYSRSWPAAIRRALWAEAEVRRLQRVIDQHDLCHDLHGKVGPEDFAAGCVAEQRRLYGRSPPAEMIERLRKVVTDLLEECTFHDQEYNHITRRKVLDEARKVLADTAAGTGTS